ncbi:MAG: hypothetical protein WCS10_06795 [Bacteroidales bacterium]|nr:hypothetical protein [Bacteroidales bacterium]MDD4829279.1 hypothetical protein [Bacteroidales bacterium]
MKKIFFFSFLLCVFFFSCSKDKKSIVVDPSTGKEVTMNINRFEDVLFDKNQQDFKAHLQANYENYKPLFNTTLDNQEYFKVISEFATDPEMISAYVQVKKRYPNLDWASNQITNAFSILLEDYPNTKIPKLYSLMFGPAEFSYSYSKRIIAQKDFIVIAIDLYAIKSLQDNKFYAQFPKYITLMLDSAYMVPDIMNSYLRNVTTENIPLVEQTIDASLCDIIVERGKYYYALTKILPNSSISSILRYTPEQMDWAEKNEYNIWGFIIQNGLLYSKDRVQYMNMISEGPTTKGLNGSPSRLGDYIGFKIVEKYMKQTNKSLKEMFETKDSKEILNKSTYKPKK